LPARENDTEPSDVMSRDELERRAWEAFESYLSLTVGPLRVACPYFLNRAEAEFRRILAELGAEKALQDGLREAVDSGAVAYGELRGKGTPEAIANAVLRLLDRLGIPRGSVSRGGLLDLMRFHGLGVDCSGLVFNVLCAALPDTRSREAFIGSLSWGNSRRRDANRAWTGVFAGKASRRILPEEARPLDLVLIQRAGRWDHVAIVLGDRSGLWIGHSTLCQSPAGVHRFPFFARDARPSFAFQPDLGEAWEEKWEQGLLEMRRLVFLERECA
jgi:hypothetical protein